MNQCRFTDVLGVHSARVPIVKCVDRLSGYQLDISMWDPVQSSKTLLLKSYIDSDERVAPFLRGIRFWSKERGIGDASTGGLSQFCLTLLGLFSLQQQLVVPVLQRRPEFCHDAPHSDPGLNTALSFLPGTHEPGIDEFLALSLSQRLFVATHQPAVLEKAPNAQVL
jgi:hypothetical protein